MRHRVGPRDLPSRNHGARVSVIHPGEVIDAEEAAVPPGVRESSAGRLTTAGSWLFVLALAVFFLFPFYAIARFVVPAGADSAARCQQLLRPVDVLRAHDSVSRSPVRDGVAVLGDLRGGSRGPHPRSDAADRDVGQPAGAAGTFTRRDADPASLHGATDRPRRRGGRGVQGHAAVVLQQPLRPHPVLRGARHAVHLPGARRRVAGHRPQDPRRRLAFARRRVDDHDRSRRRAQHASRPAQQHVPHGHGRVDGVHDGVDTRVLVPEPDDLARVHAGPRHGPALRRLRLRPVDHRRQHHPARDPHSRHRSPRRAATVRGI